MNEDEEELIHQVDDEFEEDEDLYDEDEIEEEFDEDIVEENVGDEEQAASSKKQFESDKRMTLCNKKQQQSQSVTKSNNNQKPTGTPFDFTMQALEMSLYGYLRPTESMFAGHAMSGLRCMPPNSSSSPLATFLQSAFNQYKLMNSRHSQQQVSPRSDDQNQSKGKPYTLHLLFFALLLPEGEMKI